MHPYSTDSKYRATIPAVIGIISYLIVQRFTLLNTFFPSVGLLEGWIPSFGLVWFILFSLFNYWLWKNPVLQRIGVVKTPNLNGVWEGTGTTIRPDEDSEEEYTPKVRIKQRWLRMVIELETERSKSESRGATLLLGEGVTPTLTYNYRNEPKPTTPDKMNTHRGTATLDYRTNETPVLEGSYYTDEGRRTYGELILKRQDQSSSLKNRVKNRLPKL